MHPRLSVVIPAFNESSRIGPTVAACERYCASLPYDSEIIVVDDGSTDDTARSVSHAASQRVRLIRHETNRGKGAAVRTGMLAARGDMRLFTDADNSTPIDFADALIAEIQNGADVAIGSRRLPGSKILNRQGPTRDFLGALFRTATRTMFPLDVIDTQNGFKLFTDRAAKEIFSRTKIDGFSFDLELLALSKRMGFIVAECPIEWTNDDKSRVRFRHMVRMLWDLIVLRWRFFIGEA
jgi:glycosyltransferase involved in cell wall biosynthesis